MSPLYEDSNGNVYEDLPGSVEDTEIRVVRLEFDETVTTTTPVTIPIAAMPATGIAVHGVIVEAAITQTSAGTTEFFVGTNTDVDAFAALTDQAADFKDAVDAEGANVPIFVESDVDLDAGTNEVIQLQLTEDSGGTDNALTIAGEVRIAFSRMPHSRVKRDSAGNIVLP
jgi:hypothetical protein